MCVCMPEPLSPKRGLGMKVAECPKARAAFFTTYLNFIMSSAAARSVAKR